MSEEDKVKQIALQMAETIKSALAQGQSTDQWALASKPFKSELEKEAKKRESLITKPKETKSVKTKIEVFKTQTFLDSLFIDGDEKSLDGIPMALQLGIVGLSGTGKSLLVQEIAIRMASEGKRVVFVTSEDIFHSNSPRFDLEARMMQKAKALGLDWEKIRFNLAVLDTVTHTELRDWDTFIQTYRQIDEKQSVDLLIIDSITLMETYRGALKYRILELSRYNQVHGITALYVCQRATEDTDNFGIAGGIGVAHNLDAVLCIDFKKASGRLKEDFNVKQWTLVHFARMLSCRICGFTRRYFEASITKDGLLRIVQEQTD